MKIKLNVDGQWHDDIELPVEIIGYNQRIKNSVKIFLILFVAAALSVLIPVLHFVLVPSLLVASVIMSRIKFQQTGLLDLNEFKCPRCKNAIKEKKIFFKKDDQLIRLHCYSCQSPLTFSVTGQLDKDPV